MSETISEKDNKGYKLARMLEVVARTCYDLGFTDGFASGLNIDKSLRGEK